MEEFDLEGLPLFVLANWRGFSGGQRDLFEGVLQVRGGAGRGGPACGAFCRPCDVFSPGLLHLHFAASPGLDPVLSWLGGRACI